MRAHIHAPVLFYTHPLGHEEHGLLVPAGHGAASAVDDAVAGEVQLQGSIVHGAAHETRVAGPPDELRNAAIGEHPPGRYLPDDVIDFRIEGVVVRRHGGQGSVLEVVAVEELSALGAEDFVLVDDTTAVVAAIGAFFFLGVAGCFHCLS